MAKYRFDISQTGYGTIKIQADKGLIIDDWTDLSAPSCLIVPNGAFKIQATETVFTSGGNLNFKLVGKPFDAAVGDTGDAVIELFDNGCTNLGWTWTLISKS
jgi:hypothetical protein